VSRVIQDNRVRGPDDDVGRPVTSVDDDDDSDGDGTVIVGTIVGRGRQS
jgi:hypothetical protein